MARGIPGVRQIVLLHVLYNRYPLKDPSLVHPRVKEARKALESLKTSISMPEVNVTAVVEEITGGDVSAVINQVSARMDLPMVVMGRRGTGIIEALLLGSVASDMLRYGTMDMLLIPPLGKDFRDTLDREQRGASLFDHVMICTDFSEPEVGRICAQELSPLRVSLFHAVTTGISEEEVQSASNEARARLGILQEAFTRRGIPTHIQVAVGDAPEEILAYSRDQDVSLIVLKSAGKRSPLNIIIGSTAAPVARNAVKPVLILKRPGIRNP
jgi:Universal stress protein family.